MLGILADAGGLGAVLARAATFVATIGVIGGAAFRWNAARGSDVVGAAAARTAAAAAVRAVTWGALLLLVAVPCRVFLQAQALTMEGDPVLPMVSRVFQTDWGRAAGAQFVTALVLLFAVVAERQGYARAWRTISFGALLLSVSPAYMGHANGTEGAYNTAMVADALHVLAAGGWAGGVATLTLSALMLRANVDGPAVAATLIDGFKRLALGCTAMLVLSGVVSSWIRLTAVADLAGTTYGRLLLLKVGLVAVATLLGWLHSRTAASRTRAGGAGAAGRVARSIGREAAVMLAVVLVTAVLAGSAPPGTE